MNPKPRKRMFTGFGVVLLGILALAIFWRQNFQTVVVSGPSMEITYTSGDKLLACRAYWLIGAIGRKDIVVVRTGDNAYIIKRVKGLPGDRIDLLNAPKDWPISKGDFIVPEGKLYILGDNTTMSEDSRAFGPVDSSDVLGKIVTLDPNVMPIVMGSVGGFCLVGIIIGFILAMRERRTGVAEA
ncbi:MAG: signal peptidase I [Fimbriimonadaceae bacterium]|nr:signal peptidase I [Fimbriimonadaceae bacterium]